jgi:Putative zinc-finger
MAHLGNRVSALLDGQLSPDDEERAWAHVHGCHACRDQVEREGWVKTQLVGLSFGASSVPAGLKGSLLGLDSSFLDPLGDAFAHAHAPSDRPRRLGLVAIGGGAVGAAVLGVLALGAAPAVAPVVDRRTPITVILPTATPTDSSNERVRTPSRRPKPPQLVPVGRVRDKIAW